MKVPIQVKPAQERVDSGAKASISGQAWRQPGNPAKQPGGAAGDGEGLHPEDWGYESDTPLRNMVEEQAALLSATVGKQGGHNPPDR